MKEVIKTALINSYSYNEYRIIISDLLIQGKSSGAIQSEDLTHYSSLNETRMNRLDKTIKISDEILLKLQSMKNESIWLVISEGWCGDAAQSLPIFNKMDKVSAKIEMKMILSIPKITSRAINESKGIIACVISVLIKVQSSKIHRLN
jgi:hypothetical protein